jgi:hypothetical protein
VLIILAGPWVEGLIVALTVITKVIWTLKYLAIIT